LLQRAEPHAFETQLLGWILNRNEFLHVGRDARQELMREFVTNDGL
jgi:hypothetical protein